VLLGSERDVQR